MLTNTLVDYAVRAPSEVLPLLDAVALRKLVKGMSVNVRLFAAKAAPQIASEALIAAARRLAL